MDQLESDRSVLCGTSGIQFLSEGDRAQLTALAQRTISKKAELKKLIRTHESFIRVRDYSGLILQLNSGAFLHVVFPAKAIVAFESSHSGRSFFDHQSFFVNSHKISRFQDARNQNQAHYKRLLIPLYVLDRQKYEETLQSIGLEVNIFQ